MTYLELAQKMIREVGLSITLSTVSEQTGMNRKIVDWIADADEYIQSLWFDWNFLWSQFSTSTISGIREYSKPTDFGTWDVDSFYLDYTSADYIHLVEKDYIDWRQADRPGTNENDEPSNFIIAPNNNIYLEPKPDGIYTLTADYWKTPTTMTDNEDTSPIPGRFERIIIARAKIYYAEHDEFPTVYELASAEYADLLDKLEASELPNRDVMRMSGNNLRIIPE